MYSFKTPASSATKPCDRSAYLIRKLLCRDMLLIDYTHAWQGTEREFNLGIDWFLRLEKNLSPGFRSDYHADVKSYKCCF